jgi:hypothetical protein
VATEHLHSLCHGALRHHAEARQLDRMALDEEGLPV